MKVAVYYNLHKHVFSLQSRNKEDYGRVIGHTDHVILKNVKFIVREAGRNKVLKEKRKNVHAYVVGEITDSHPDVSTMVSYNPYKKATFFNKETNEDVHTSEYAVLKKDCSGKPTIGVY